ncbi:MAG: acetate/propionate family kinase [Arenimonas sp.]
MLNIFALNCGSSSLKFGMYKTDYSACEWIFSGEIESIGSDKSEFRLRDSLENMLLHETLAVHDHHEAIIRIETLFTEGQLPIPDAIGHRIVHGGPRLRNHCIIDENVLHELETAVAFAPLHTPASLSVIRFCRKRFPELPQVACFDTTFHKDLPEVARILPIARELQLEGIQRYGFHGLSCESVLQQLAANMPARLIIAHLGNGASVTAIEDSKSVDTSMGLTPAGGMMMGTRSGDLDPGVMLYFLKQQKFDAARLEDLLNHQSGLLGVSGLSSDMQVLHKAAASNSNAKLAIKMFCYFVRKEIAAMISAMEGIDMLVFTGGIGENDAIVRDEICSGLSWIGILLDEASNEAASNPIHKLSSSCAVHVLPSREETQIALHTHQLCSQQNS